MLPSVQMETPKSVSPATFAFPPMAQTVVQPPSAMSSIRVPKTAIQPVNFTQLPGGAIAVAASPDGSIWVLSSAGSGPDRAIWHYVSGTWTNIPGAASRLATAPDNTLWVVNSAGGIYHWNGSSWTGIAGGASEITVGSDGSVYVISNQGGGPYGRGIWHFSGGDWTQLPGAAVKIAANWDTGTYAPNIAPGGFYVINAGDSVFYYNPSTGFAQLPGGVVQLAPTKIGGTFALGYIQNGDGSFPIYYNDLATNTWTRQPGAAISIATDSVHVYAIGAAGGIYSSPVTPASSGPPQCPSGTARKTLAAVQPGVLMRRAPRGRGGIVPNRLYVRYASAAGTRAIDSVERSVAIARSVDLGSARGTRLRAITLAPGADRAAAVATLRSDPNVVDVLPVHYRGLSSDPAAGANDKYFDSVDQWYLYKTNVVRNGGANGAWNLTTGNSAVSVAVIDTGVDLTGPTLGGHDFVVDVAEQILNGAKTTGNSAVQDTNGHGTNTSGLATAQANNGYGFAGVGYTVHLQAYKIFPDTTAANTDPSASTDDEAAAINDAVSNGASVISLSLGSPQSSGSDFGEQSAIENALASNVAVVAANGNEFGTGSDGLVSDYPAGYPGVIAVGASAAQDCGGGAYSDIIGELDASYSNSGPTLLAPGGDASSTSDNDTLHWIEGYFTTTSGDPSFSCGNSGSPATCRVLYNGTSQATPQVAGTIALMESYHGGPRSLTPAQAASILTSTADHLPGISSDRQGAGRLNAGRAVSAAHP